MCVPPMCVLVTLLRLPVTPLTQLGPPVEMEMVAQLGLQSVPQLGLPWELLPKTQLGLLVETVVHPWLLATQQELPVVPPAETAFVQLVAFVSKLLVNFETCENLGLLATVMTPAPDDDKNFCCDCEFSGACEQKEVCCDCEDSEACDDEHFYCDGDCSMPPISGAIVVGVVASTDVIGKDVYHRKKKKANWGR